MKYNIKSGMVASAAITAILLAGCGTTNKPAAVDASSISCGQVSHQLTAAQASVQKDSAAISKTAGTPDSQSAQDKRTQDANKVVLLTARQTQCQPPPAPPIPVTSPQPTLTAEQLATQLAGHFDSYTIGANTATDTLLLGSQVTTANHTAVRGTNSFSERTLTSPQEVGAFLQSDTASRTRVVNSLTAAGYGQSEINRALNGDGYFAVQETVPSQIYGTSYKVGDTSVVEDGARTVPANDIQWLYATTDGKIIYGAAIRADCGNPNLIRVVPVTPSTPPAPPVSCMNANAPGCQPPAAPPGTTPPETAPPGTTPPGTAPPETAPPGTTPPGTAPPTTCHCVTPTQASQPVIDPQSPVPQYTQPPQQPGVTAPPTAPTPPQSAPAGTVPPPSSGTYSNGGTGSAPSGAQCSDPNNCTTSSPPPQPSGPAATPYSPPSTANSTDPGAP